jgi:molybdate transport system substrate-binding protein
MEKILPEFTAATDYKVTATFTAIGAITDRVRKGEHIDLATVSSRQWDDLAKAGKIDPATRVVIAKVGLALFVRNGSTKPDIHSVDEFKRTLLSARSFALGDPAIGSPVGAYASQLFERLGIAAEMRSKLKLVAGLPVAPVAKGEVDAELGMAQLSEIVSVPGVTLVDLLPSEIQNFTIYTTAIPVSAHEPLAAKKLVDFLKSASARQILEANGLQTGDAP